MKKIVWFLFSFFAVFIGLFPFFFYIFNIPFGIIEIKSLSILDNLYWKIGFHIHIIFGAIALLIGWIQFIPKWRAKYLIAHRIMGKVYIISILISGLSSLFISFYANGGTSAFLGLFTGTLVWLSTAILGYYYIRSKKVDLHKKIMVYNYAITFGGVTLRIWLPLLIIYLDDFDLAYNIVTWLSWLPNLIAAYFINRMSRTISNPNSLFQNQ